MFLGGNSTIRKAVDPGRNPAKSDKVNAGGLNHVMSVFLLSRLCRIDNRPAHALRYQKGELYGSRGRLRSE